MLQLSCSIFKTKQKTKITKHWWKDFRKMIFIKIYNVGLKWYAIDISPLHRLVIIILKYFHWIQEHENIPSGPKITKIGQWFAEGGPSSRVHGVSSHLGRHLGFWKMLTVELDLPVCHTDTLTSQSGLFQSINVIVCHFQQDFHWWVTPDASYLKYHHDICFFCFQMYFQRVCGKRSIIVNPWNLRPSWMSSWILKHAQGWTQFTRQILFMWCIKLQNQVRNTLYQTGQGMLTLIFPGVYPVPSMFDHCLFIALLRVIGSRYPDLFVVFIILHRLINSWRYFVGISWGFFHVSSGNHVIRENIFQECSCNSQYCI